MITRNFKIIITLQLLLFSFTTFAVDTSVPKAWTYSDLEQFCKGHDRYSYFNLQDMKMGKIQVTCQNREVHEVDTQIFYKKKLSHNYFSEKRAKKICAKFKNKDFDIDIFLHGANNRVYGFIYCEKYGEYIDKNISESPVKHWTMDSLTRYCLKGDENTEYILEDDKLGDFELNCSFEKFLGVSVEIDYKDYMPRSYFTKKRLKKICKKSKKRDFAINFILNDKTDTAFWGDLARLSCNSGGEVISFKYHTDDNF